jgi:predicted component of type VI protein secretion system
MTDRPMTPELAAALAGLTAADRRQLKAIAPESKTPWLRALLLGLVVEVEDLERRESIAKMNEITTLHAHEMDHLADVDKAAEGADWPTEPEDRSKGEPWWPRGKI